MTYRQFSKMKLGGSILLCFLFVGILTAQNLNPDQLRQKMAKIRQSTNWNDPAAAKRANGEIQKLSKQLMMSGQNSNASKNYQMKEEEEKNVDFKMGVWKQMMESVSKGEGADIDLAAPLRKNIAKAYRDDEDPTIKNSEYLESFPYLLINMSMPNIQVIIDQMPAFKGIKKLIITCEKEGTYVDLTKLLQKASSYPLEELYILNFGSTINKLPNEVGNFLHIRTLVILNNNIKQLPAAVSKLKDLKTLYADKNPINSLVAVITPLMNLSELGITETNISEAEIQKIHKDLPNCKILK